MPLPRISIVTPSFNQGRFLERTLRSILDQDYPNLEYVVMDGGSTDGSVEIIRRYAPRLAYWVSEKDGGQYDAINKGFAHTTGEIMTWLNSDDIYVPRALHVVAAIFAQLPEVQWLTTSTRLCMDEEDAITAALPAEYCRTWFRRGLDLWGLKPLVQQESTFWRRGLWQRAGACVDASFHYAGDHNLWARFWEHAQLVTTSAPIAVFRVHAAQKTIIPNYVAEAEKTWARYRVAEPAWRRLARPLARWMWTRLGLGRGFTDRVSRVEYDRVTSRWTLKERRIVP
jgi:glycosyltransferase involved in cell wall biosynthesis